MSLEICKKVHKKLRTNSLNKTSSLRRKIRKTSRRKRKRRRNGSGGCGCTNIVNMDNKRTTTATAKARTIATLKTQQQHQQLPTAITKRTRITKTTTTRKTTTTTSTTTNTTAKSQKTATNVKPSSSSWSLSMATIGPALASLSVLRSCKVNANSKRKQNLQQFYMHNYSNNNNSTRYTTANNMKFYNNNNNKNNNNTKSSSSSSYYTTTTSTSTNNSYCCCWQRVKKNTRQQRIQRNHINCICPNIMTSQVSCSTNLQSCYSKATARIPCKTVSAAETIASAPLTLEYTSPFAKKEQNSKKVQLYLEHSHQQQQLVYLHTQQHQRATTTSPTIQEPHTQRSGRESSSGGPCRSINQQTTIRERITRAMHRTLQNYAAVEYDENDETQKHQSCHSKPADAILTTYTLKCLSCSIATCSCSCFAPSTVSTATKAALPPPPLSSPSPSSSSSSSASPSLSATLSLSLLPLLFSWWLPLLYVFAVSSVRWWWSWWRRAANHCTRCYATSCKTFDSSAPRIQRKKKLFQGLFMTLLVLSICNNNVLETSAAATIRTSNTQVLSSSLQHQQQMALLSSLSSNERALPQTITNTTTTMKKTRANALSVISVTKNSNASVLLTAQAENSESWQHRQNSDSPLSSSSSSTSLFSETQTNQRPDLKEFTQQMKTMNIEQNAGRQRTDFMPAKRKRQQRVQQLPQYLTSTQETSFSQNGMTLETGNNRSFQSLSIVDGRLTVPMDMEQQQQMHHQQQQQQNEHQSTSGSSQGSSGNNGFLVDGNEMVPFPKRHSMPVFDFGMPRNITARTGHMEAVIKCRVDRLDDKSVSWIRKRDLHILTVGKTTYTSDKRFQVTESKDSREWVLHVKSPQARDSGIYECQVNTEPKMSMAFQLNIIEISPDVKAVITGPADLYFKVGSAIILTCIVHQPSVKDIGPIHWYRGEYLITPFDVNDDETVKHDDFGTSAALTSKSHAYEQSNTDMYDNTADDEEEQMSQILTNEITKDFTQRIAMEQQLCDTIKSKLRIANAQKSDSGNYTCQPTTASSASVMVHVINDENPAAMQKSGAATTHHAHTLPLALFLFTVSSIALGI